MKVIKERTKIREMIKKIIFALDYESIILINK